MTTYEIEAGAVRCTVTVDEELCTGTGLCMVYGPDTFDMNDDLKSVVKPDTSDEIAVIQAAAESCPNRAITVTEK
jgi:ferredoxin